MTETTNDRPYGLSIIAFLILLNGFVKLFLMLSGISSLDNPETIDLVLEHFEWILLLLLGFGLIKGKIWSWWITIVLMVANVLLGIYDAININVAIADLGMIEGEVLSHILKRATVVFVQIILVIYLFSKDVFNFFNLSSKTRLKKIMTVLAINAVLAGLYYWTLT